MSSAKAAPAPPAPVPSQLRPTRPVVDNTDGPPAQAPAGAFGPSEADLAQATTAESGPKGGTCNMARLLQTALRADPRVQTAIRRSPAATGRPLVVWHGDWIRSAGESGGGLAGLREVMSVEIAFAPKACQNQPMHGLVLLTLSDGPGAPRLVVGGGEWRWSDLLMLKPEHVGDGAFGR